MVDLSIIIINKNYLTFLKKCLDSCLNQVTKYSYEVILVDDGSTDGSVLFAKKIKDKKLKIFHTKNKGIEHASNKGFKTIETKLKKSIVTRGNKRVGRIFCGSWVWIKFRSSKN